MKMHRLILVSVLMLLGFGCRLLSASPATSPEVAITQVTPLTQTVYYGQATCGPTTFLVGIQVQGTQPPSQVGLQYRYVGSQQSDWLQVLGTPSGMGQYQVTLSLDAATAQTVGATALEYRAFAVDAQGNMTFSPAQGTYQVPLQPCQQQGVAPDQDREPPRILNVATSNTPVYYQGTCGPTSLTVTALVVDNSGQAQVTLEYWFAANRAQVYKLPMQAQGTLYAVTVPVNQQAAKDLQGKSSQLEYRVVATDAAGNTATYPTGAQVAGAVEVYPCQQAGGSTGGSAAQPPQSGGGSGSSLTIQDVRTNPPDATYFGACTAGETTWVKVEVVVNDIQKVKKAKVYYRYELSSAPGTDFPDSAPMYRQQGIGNYMAHIDVGQELPDHAAVDRMAYYVEILTTDGKTVKSSVYYHPLLPCTGQGQPPQPPALNITDVFIYPDTAFYGACNAGEPTEIFFQVTVNDADRVASATVYYEFYAGGAGTGKTGALNLGLDQGNFVGTLDLTTQLSPQDTVDQVVYVIEVTSTGGDVVTYGPDQISVQTCTVTGNPRILYFESLHENNEVVVNPVSPLLFRWETENANCGVYLNGELVNEDEPNEYAAGHVGEGSIGETLTFTLEAYGGDCSMPLVDRATVTLTVVAPDSGQDDSGGATNYRLSNYEQLYFGQSFDLDWDGTTDFYLFAGPTQFTLEAENGASLAYGRWGGDYGTTIATCSAILNVYGVSSVDIELDKVICIKTGAGFSGYVIIEELYNDPDDLTQSYIIFGLASETP